MSRPNPAVTLSLRVQSELRDQLEALSEATGRTKSFLAAEAIAYYLAVQAWQVKGIQDAINKADSSEASFSDHHEVAKWVDDWKNE